MQRDRESRVGALSRVALLLLAVGGVVVLAVAAFLGGVVPTPAYDYDGVPAAQTPDANGASQAAREQVTTGPGAFARDQGTDYDDRAQPARLDEYRSAPNTADDLARLPVGRRGRPMDVPRGTNSPSTIGDRQYGGHALDEMMSEGFTPSVDDAIRFGQATTGASGRVGYYSSANNVTVIIENGRVVTVSSGQLKVR